MKLINIFAIIIIIITFVENQVPSDKVINTCGNLGYEMPRDETECKQKEEICCYVQLSIPGGEKSFCVSAPSIIKQNDVEKDINTFTGYTLKKLVCNDYSYNIKNNFIKSILLIIFLLY